MPGTISLPRFVLRDLAAERVEHAAEAGEHALHAIGGLAAHLAVVDEVFPLRRRHHDLGIRERRLVVGRQQAVDVVAVDVGDDDDVDLIAVDAGRLQIGVELAGGALAVLEVRFAGAGVDDDQPRAGVDRARTIRDRDHVGRRLQIGGRQRRIDLLAALVGDEAVRKLEPVHPVGRDRHLDARRLYNGTSRRACWPESGAAACAGEDRAGVSVAAPAAAAPVSTVRRLTAVMEHFLPG